jgi:hypothetical protein
MMPATQPTPELTTERTRGQRRAALAAVAIVAVIVGALIWKPWDSPSGAPRSTAVAALPTSTSESSPVDATITPPAVFLPRPVVTAAPTDTFDSGPQIIDAADNLGSIAFYPNEGPAVWCIYKPGPAGGSAALSVILVEPPIVIVGDGASPRLRTVRWHIELETNTQDKLFDADWIPNMQSKAQVINVARGEIGFVKPISVDVPQADSITIFRAPMVFDWLGPNRTVLDSQRVVPMTYQTLGATDSALQPGGCPTVI